MANAGEPHDTNCPSESCDYKEVAGSPYYATYYGAVLKHYLGTKGVESVYIGKESIPIEYLFNPRGMLDALLIHTHDLVQESFHGLKMGATLFSVIRDEKAVLKRRVVVSAPLESLADGMNRMVTYLACGTFAIDQTLAITKSQSQSQSSPILQLGDMHTTGAALKEAFPEYFTAKSTSPAPGAR
jgi:hypothetical protein